jgi:hypothetical protein
MEMVDRTLTADVIAALTYWPGIIWVGQKNPPDPVDISVLLPFFNELLQELPWWNRDWKVSHVEPGTPQQHADDDRGSMVLRPAVAPPGRLEPHPFATVLTGLMDLRGISIRAMALGTARSMSTIHLLRSGRLNPKPRHVHEIAGVLALSEADVIVIAGLDDGVAR